MFGAAYCDQAITELRGHLTCEYVIALYINFLGDYSCNSKIFTISTIIRPDQTKHQYNDYLHELIPLSVRTNISLSPAHCKSTFVAFASVSGTNHYLKFVWDGYSRNPVNCKTT